MIMSNMVILVVTISNTMVWQQSPSASSDHSNPTTQYNVSLMVVQSSDAEGCRYKSQGTKIRGTKVRDPGQRHKSQGYKSQRHKRQRYKSQRAQMSEVQKSEAPLHDSGTDHLHVCMRPEHKPPFSALSVCALSGRLKEPQHESPVSCLFGKNEECQSMNTSCEPDFIRRNDTRTQTTSLTCIRKECMIPEHISHI